LETLSTDLAQLKNYAADINVNPQFISPKTPAADNRIGVRFPGFEK
jgi:hypothetical protein